MAKDRVGEELAKQDWKEVHARLVKFAQQRTGNPSQAMDLTQQAIRRVFEPDSSWDPSRVELLAYLMGDIKTLLKNERRRGRRTRSYDHHGEEEDDTEQFADERSFDEARHAEGDLDARRLKALRALAANREDDDGLHVVELRTEGADTPAAVRDATGWDMNRVNRAWLRVQRAALEVARELPDDDEVQ